MSGFPSFLRLNNISIYVHIIFFIIHSYVETLGFLWQISPWVLAFTSFGYIPLLMEGESADFLLWASVLGKDTKKNLRSYPLQGNLLQQGKKEKDTKSWTRLSPEPTQRTKIRSVQFSHSVVSNSLLPPWTAARQGSLSITSSRGPPKPMSIESVMPPNHLILCCPLLLLPSSFPSIRVFSNESALCIRWPKYWSFSFSISPSSEHPGMISFRMDWLDLLAGQGTLKSLLQHHSSKASILRHSAFFIVQLSHPYMTTGKTIALTRWIFVAK